MVFVFILAMAPVYSLGVVPSRKTITFEPNLEKNIKLKLMDINGKVSVYTEGDLKPYIELDKSFYNIQESGVISYTLSLPETLDEPGNHLGKIIIRSIPEDFSGETSVGASVEVVSKLNVFVPYKGRFAEAKLHMPTFERGKTTSFVVEVENLGDEDITDALVFVDILGPFGDKIKTLKSKEGRIASKKTRRFLIEWTPDVQSGEYKAKATVVYGEENVFDEKNFKIGEPDVNIVSLSAGEYELGGIAKFDILVESKWNRPMENVKGEIAVVKEREVLTRSETPEKTLPAYGKQKLSTYWETKKAGVGEYELDTRVNYLNKKKERKFDIQIKPNEIVVQSPTGKITEGGESFFDKYYQLIIVIILIIVVVLNVYMFRKMRSG